MRFITGLWALSLSACAIDGVGPAGPPPGAGASAPPLTCQAGEELVREYPSFTVRYPQGLEDDEQQLGTFAQSALDSLEDVFAAHGGAALIADVDIRISIYASATPLANPGRITLDMREEAGRTLAEIHVLAPSCHDIKGMTLVGDPYDENYFHRVLTHELGTLFLLGITESKTVGWSLFDAPSWFSEGFEEYLGVNYSSEYSRDVTQALYLRAVLDDPSRVAVELHADNAYLDGANLVRFLHERYGATTLQAVLSSERSTFWEAIKEETGLGPAELVEAFHAWLAGVGK